jgi:hypothetical protein
MVNYRSKGEKSLHCPALFAFDVLFLITEIYRLLLILNWAELFVFLKYPRPAWPATRTSSEIGGNEQNLLTKLPYMS